MQIAVSGLGRIGRSFTRALLLRNPANVKLKAFHDIVQLDSLVYLLKHDSVRGTFLLPILPLGDKVIIDEHDVSFFKSISPPNWGAINIDLVVDCSGQRTSRGKAIEHLQRGARAVLVSAPVDDPDRTIVYGFDHQLLTGQEKVISTASCTTNCLVHMLSTVKQIAKIEYVLMSTVHSYTADQRLVDAAHEDARRGRAAAVNIVPTTTGAARATSLVMTDLKGRIDGCSFRVPVPDVSLVDLTLQLMQPTDAKQINEQFTKTATDSSVLEAWDGPIVSSDIIGNPASCILDLGMTTTVGTLVKLVGWYDNEWGYANRMIDTLCYLEEIGQKGSNHH